MIYNRQFSEETQMTYAIDKGRCIILHYDGDEARVRIPDTIDDFPVTCIENYAFAEKSMKYIQLPIHLQVIEHHAFSRCKQLTHVIFPPELKSIGNYAFFNCWELTQVHFTPYIRSIGFGAFMNCDKLTEVIQEKKDGLPISLGSLMDERIQQIHLEMRQIHDDGQVEIARLTFTEYVAEVVANAAIIASMCKQFMSEYTGSGRSLRYCISSDGIDYKAYDSMFIKIMFKDSFDIAITVAMERLMFPCGLLTSAREVYLSYVTEHAQEAALKFVKEDDQEKLKALLEFGLLDEEAASKAIDLTIQLGRTEFTALLMDYTRSNSDSDSLISDAGMDDLDFDLGDF